MKVVMTATVHMTRGMRCEVWMYMFKITVMKNQAMRPTVHVMRATSGVVNA